MTIFILESVSPNRSGVRTARGNQVSVTGTDGCCVVPLPQENSLPTCKWVLFSPLLIQADRNFSAFCYSFIRIWKTVKTFAGGMFAVRRIIMAYGRLKGGIEYSGTEKCDNLSLASSAWQAYNNACREKHTLTSFFRTAGQ